MAIITHYIVCTSIIQDHKHLVGNTILVNLCCQHKFILGKSSVDMHVNANVVGPIGNELCFDSDVLHSCCLFNQYIKLACPLKTCEGTKIVPTPALHPQRCTCAWPASPVTLFRVTTGRRRQNSLTFR